MSIKKKFKYQKIAVIGGGYIGAVLSGVLAEYGLNVDIIDINVN